MLVKTKRQVIKYISRRKSGQRRTPGTQIKEIPGKVVFRPKYLPDSDWRSEQPCEPLEQSEIKIGTVNGKQSIGESIRTVKSCDKE